MPRKSLIDYFCFLSKVYVCAKRCWFTSLVFFRRVAQKKNETLTTERKSLKFIIMKLYLILFLVQNLLNIIM